MHRGLVRGARGRPPAQLIPLDCAQDSPCPCVAPATRAARPTLPPPPPHWGSLGTRRGGSEAGALARPLTAPGPVQLHPPGSAPPTSPHRPGLFPASGPTHFLAWHRLPSRPPPQLTKHAGGDAGECLGRAREVRGNWGQGHSPPASGGAFLPQFQPTPARRAAPPHRGAEPVLQQQVEAAQVAAAELGSLAGAGLSMRDGSHRVDDIYERRRGQTGGVSRGSEAVSPCRPRPWRGRETGPLPKF